MAFLAISSTVEVLEISLKFVLVTETHFQKDFLKEKTNKQTHKKPQQTHESEQELLMKVYLIIQDFAAEYLSCLPPTLYFPTPCLQFIISLF